MQNLKNFVKLDRELKDLVFFYKCRNGFTDLNVYDLVSPVSHGRTRLSNSYNLKTPAVCKTNTFQASYFNRIVKLWNYICKFSPPTSFSTTASFLPSWLFNLLYVTFVMVNKAVKKKRKKKKKKLIKLRASDWLKTRAILMRHECKLQITRALPKFRRS